MTDCEKFMEQISALVDAELSNGEEAAVLAHIAECPDCAAVYEAFTAIAKCLPQMTVTPPDNLKDSIMLKIKDEARKSRKPKLSFLRYAGLAAVFALVIFAAVNSGKVTSPETGTDSPADASVNAIGGADAFADAAPSDSFGASLSGIRGMGKESAPSLPDMRYFSNYLESIPSEEYQTAVDEYEGKLYGLLVLEGDVPTVLKDTDKLLENKSEVYLEVSKDEIESLCKDSDDSWLIINDASAEKGIVIIKKDEDYPITTPEE